MSEINARMEELRQHGYQADKFYELLQNDNDTDTIVYTSPEFQPMADTFSSPLPLYRAVPLRFLSRQPPKEDVPWFTFLWEPC